VSPPSTPAVHDVTRKRVATVQAASALRGFELHAIEDDRGAPLYVINKDGLTRQLSGLQALDELEAWARGAGVRI
jgi:hypothetical protein